MEEGDRVLNKQWPGLGRGTVAKAGTEVSLVRWDNNYLKHKVPKYDYVANVNLIRFLKFPLDHSTAAVDAA